MSTTFVTQREAGKMLGIDGRTFAKIVIPYGTLISGGREVFIYTISQVETVAKQLKEHNHAR